MPTVLRFSRVVSTPPPRPPHGGHLSLLTDAIRHLFRIARLSPVMLGHIAALLAATVQRLERTDRGGEIPFETVAQIVQETLRHL